MGNAKSIPKKLKSIPGAKPDEVVTNKPAPVHEEEWQRGRRKLTTTANILPVDPAEMQRANLFHESFKIYLGSIYRAPLDKPKRILDVGTGNGVWAREMAGLFPKATVVGLDLAEDVLYRENLPANCRMDVGDVILGLPYEDNTFDYVHMGLMCAAIPVDAWYKVINEVGRVCKPGGYVEFLEYVGPTEPQIGPGINYIFHFLDGIAHTNGLSYQFLESGRWEALIQNNKAFESVDIHKWMLPMGGWAGQAGILSKTSLYYMFMSMGAIAVPPEEEETFIDMLNLMSDECEMYQVVSHMRIVVCKKKK